MIEFMFYLKRAEMLSFLKLGIDFLSSKYYNGFMELEK